MRTLSEFAVALSDAKKARKLTANALAQRTGLTPQAVRQILAGESAPRLTNAMALASELGLELVLLPKDAAQSLAAPQHAQRTVMSDVERLLRDNPALRLEDLDGLCCTNSNWNELTPTPDAATPWRSHTPLSGAPVA